MSDLSKEELAFRIKIGQIKPEDAAASVKPAAKKDEE